MEETLTLVVATLAATLRVATPLVLCAMGGLFSEKSGIIDVGLEGKMLMAAFFAAATASLTGSAWAGVAAAILAAEMLALLHGFACITHRGNQVVSGIAINILARGIITRLYTRAYFEGEALNTTDPLLGMIAEPSRRATLLARPEGSTVWRLDIRLQGDSETVFIDI